MSSFFSTYWNKLLDWIRSIFFSKELELTILGLQNAGKSTFVNVLATGKFDEDQIPTIGFNFRKLKKGKVEFKLWDLGGQQRFRDSWEKYCRTSSAIVFVIDSADLGTLDIAKVQLKQLLQWPSVEGVPLLVELNNIKDRTVACYSISCKNMNNIDTALKWLSDVQVKKK